MKKRINPQNRNSSSLSKCLLILAIFFLDRSYAQDLISISDTSLNGILVLNNSKILTKVNSNKINFNLIKHESKKKSLAFIEPIEVKHMLRKQKYFNCFCDTFLNVLGQKVTQIDTIRLNESKYYEIILLNEKMLKVKYVHKNTKKIVTAYTFVFCLNKESK